MENSVELKKIANELAMQLVNKGYIVHRYNSYSTESVYLKVDYGLGKSIRISNHEGKGHLRYTYNIRGDISKSYSECDNGVTRNYIPFSEWESVLGRVDSHVKNLKEVYSEGWYNRELKKYERMGKSSLGKGFWQGAFKVKKK